MTLKAREVLADCRVARELLEDETDLQKWRIHWAAAVALVRAVGSVLDRVDGTDPSVRKIATAHYQLWKNEVGEEHLIFREFIKKERDLLLHEYRSNVHSSEGVAIALEYALVPVNGGPMMKARQVFELDENIYRPMLNGPWEDNDAREVLTMAIDWWQSRSTR